MSQLGAVRGSCYPCGVTLVDYISIGNGLLLVVLTLIGFVLTLKPALPKHRRRWAAIIGTISALWLGVFIWQQIVTRVSQRQSDAASEQDRQTAREATKKAQEKSDGLIEGLRQQIEALQTGLTRKPLVVQKLAPPPIRQKPEPGLPPAVVSEIRFTERRTDSPKKEFPYALQVIIQTNVAIQPAAFKIECDGELAEGSFFVAGQPALMNVRFGTSGNVFVLSFGMPAFTPESSIVATLLSKSPIRVKRVERVRS